MRLAIIMPGFCRHRRGDRCSGPRLGGIGAIIAWQILSLWTSLTMYALLIGLAGLLIGPRIFRDRGMRANAGTWSYGYLTLIVILAPAVMDSMGGSPAGAKFQERLLMFIGATLYGIVAVYVFDAFRPDRFRKAREHPAQP